MEPGGMDESKSFPLARLSQSSVSIPNQIESFQQDFRHSKTCLKER